jgi:hypothetical protein
MIYLSDEGTLAGLYYGRRRLALGERWDRQYHVYLGLGGRFAHRARAATGAEESAECDRVATEVPPLPLAEARS